MKSFFQSFSFLRDKKSLQTILEKKVDSGWLFPRFFVLALLSYLLWFLFALFASVGVYFWLSYQDYDLSAKNVSHNFTIVSNNILSEVPQDFSLTLSNMGLSSNLKEPLLIHNWVFSSGAIDEKEWKGYRDKVDMNPNSGFLLLDTVNDEPDFSLAMMTFTKDSYGVTENGQARKNFYNRRWDLDQLEEPVTLTYTAVQEFLPQVNEWILAHRDRMRTLLWVGMFFLSLFWTLFAAVFISLFTILITYLWALFTRLLSKILNKGRDYDSSYNRTILAVFPLFVLNRFVGIPWFIDLLMILILVVVMDSLSSKNK